MTLTNIGPPFQGSDFSHSLGYIFDDISPMVTGWQNCWPVLVWPWASHLTCITLLANSTDDKLIFFLFYQKIGYDISCKLSPKEKICIERQSLFSGKNTINLSSADFAQKVVTMNLRCFSLPRCEMGTVLCWNVGVNSLYVYCLSYSSPQRQIRSLFPSSCWL